MRQHVIRDTPKAAAAVHSYVSNTLYGTRRKRRRRFRFVPRKNRKNHVVERARNAERRPPTIGGSFAASKTSLLSRARRAAHPVANMLPKKRAKKVVPVKKHGDENKPPTKKHKLATSVVSREA
jgi:hypothetical protein